MIAVLDYDAGNLTSMRWALKHVGARVRVVRTALEAEGAERIVFPGVGSAATCMAQLRERGFDQTLADAFRRGTPTLAVCIGMQLLFDTSEEDGGTRALGILPGAVRRFVFPPGAPQKIPHMGWNPVEPAAPHPLWGGGPFPDGGDAFYFVHSYHVVPGWGDSPAGPRVCGVTEYGGLRFASAVAAGSLFAAQFHPERSGDAGLALLRRFMLWDGRPCF